MDIKKIDERRNIAIARSPEETVEFAVKHFVDSAKKAIDDHDGFFVALSGGSTPKKIFQKLSQPPYDRDVIWNKMHIFWSDERSVGPDDIDSNYKMAMDNGLAKLPIPKEQIFRMKGEGDIAKHAAEYEKTVCQKLKGRTFDLIMLGMGDDGHTASLFQGTEALSVTDRLVVANKVPQKKTWRMTFTYPLINSGNNIVFYVLGEGKKEQLKEVLLNPNTNAPSARVGTKEHPALWIVDKNACWIA